MEAKQIWIEEAPGKIGERVELRGWMWNRRSSKTVHFLQLRDGTGFIQGILDKESADPALWDLASSLQMESSLRVRGALHKDERAPMGGCELRVDWIEPIQVAENYPISKKDHGPDFLLDHRHLWLRSRRQWAQLRIRNSILRTCRNFFDARNFVLIDAPMFTPNACEGTTTLFEVDYFGEKAYLSQSGQLYMEAAAMAFGKVYCLGPAFRAEKSKTRRHLIEFWMIEPEVAFMDWQQNMDLQEALVCEIVAKVLEECPVELKMIERDVTKLQNVKAPFPRIDYGDAIQYLIEKGRPVKWGDDFGAEDETLVSEKYDRPVFVYKYPAHLKAFYMKPDPDNPKVALCNDLLAPEGYGEIVGAGQRMDDGALLAQRIEEHQLPQEAFGWYTDLRKYGSVPHSGFGMGIERMVAWICGLAHVRETIPFPRLLYRNKP